MCEKCVNPKMEHLPEDKTIQLSQKKLPINLKKVRKKTKTN